jgi:hypothetical protein
MAIFPRPHKISFNTLSLILSPVHSLPSLNFSHSLSHSGSQLLGRQLVLSPHPFFLSFASILVFLPPILIFLPPIFSYRALSLSLILPSLPRNPLSLRLSTHPFVLMSIPLALYLAGGIANPLCSTPHPLSLSHQSVIRVDHGLTLASSPCHLLPTP